MDTQRDPLWMVECFIPGQGEAVRNQAEKWRRILLQECFKRQGDKLTEVEEVDCIPGFNRSGFRVALQTRGLHTNSRVQWPYYMTSYMGDMARREQLNIVVESLIFDLAHQDSAHIHLFCPEQEDQTCGHNTPADSTTGPLAFETDSMNSKWEGLLPILDLDRTDAALARLDAWVMGQNTVEGIAIKTRSPRL